MNYKNIPQELKETKQWIYYDRTSKEPYASNEDSEKFWPATGFLTNETNCWKAFGALKPNKKYGIGFVFTPADPFIGIDIDACLDPNTGQILPEYKEEVEKWIAFFDSYAERSPSKTGLHIFIKGELFNYGCKQAVEKGTFHYEMYCQKRYFTVTGDFYGELKPIREVDYKPFKEAVFQPCDYHISNGLIKADPRDKRQTDLDRWIAACCTYFFPLNILLDGPLNHIYKEGGNSRYSKITGSGADGVELKDEGLWFFSHHHTDGELCYDISGRSFNAYDLIRLLLCNGEIEKTVTYLKTIPEIVDLKASFDSEINEAIDAPEALPETAYVGLLGEFVRDTHKHVESTPELLFMNLLAGLSTIVSGKIALYIHNSEIPPIIPLLTVAGAGAGKGTTQAILQEIIKQLDPTFKTYGNLASAARLVELLRDPYTEISFKKVKGQSELEPVEKTDPGVEDKRMLLLKEEMSEFFAAREQNGNTISQTLKVALEGKRLDGGSKATPYTCEKPLVNIIGHIQPSILSKQATTEDIFGGFLSRFLCIFVGRTKSRPGGGCIPQDKFEHWIERLKPFVEAALPLMEEEVLGDEDSGLLWRAFLGYGARCHYYAHYDEYKNTPYTVAARTRVFILKVAFLLAWFDTNPDTRSLKSEDTFPVSCEDPENLLEEKNNIIAMQNYPKPIILRERHILAAEQIVKLSTDSFRFSLQGNKDAQEDNITEDESKLLNSLPKTRTEVTRDVFGGHKNKAEINKMLFRLQTKGLILVGQNLTENAKTPTTTYYKS